LEAKLRSALDRVVFLEQQVGDLQYAAARIGAEHSALATNCLASLLEQRDQGGEGEEDAVNIKGEVKFKGEAHEAADEADEAAGTSTQYFSLADGDEEDAIEQGTRSQVAQVQTDIGFPNHSMACVVAQGALNTTFIGLAELAQERLKAHGVCIVNAQAATVNCATGGEVILEGLRPFVLSSEVAGFEFDAVAVQRAQVALNTFQTAAQSWVTQQLQLVETVVAKVSIEGARGSTAPNKTLKRRSQRERKRIEAHMMKVRGNNILEARAHAKSISEGELHAMEEQLHLVNRRPMRPSRRRRRLAWCLWGGSDACERG
jgi:hypothetical protein